MSDTPDTITVAKIENCARCLGTHKGLVFSKLQHPVGAGSDAEFQYWAPCPTNKEPILLYANIAVEDNGI